MPMRQRMVRAGTLQRHVARPLAWEAPSTLLLCSLPSPTPPVRPLCLGLQVRQPLLAGRAHAVPERLPRQGPMRPWDVPLRARLLGGAHVGGDSLLHSFRR